MNKYLNKYRITSSRAPFWDYGWNAAYFVTICTQNRIHYFGEISGNKMKLSAAGHIANSCWHEIPNHFPFVQLGAHIIMPNHVHGIVIINKPVVGNDDGRLDDHTVGTRNAVKTQNFASLRSLSGPSSSDPSSSDPSPSDPSPSDPSTSDPSPSDPSTSDPSSSDPSTSVPSPSDPSSSVPSTSVPSTSDPSSSDPSSSVPSPSDPLDSPKPSSESGKPKNKFGPQSQNLASIIRGFKIGVTKNARQIHPEYAWQPRYHDRIVRNEKAYQNISEYIINNPLKWGEDKFN